MKTLESRLVLDLNRGPGNPRNGEGSFIRLDNGTILFAFSRFIGNHGDDHQPSSIALVRSRDEGETWSEPEIIATAEEFGATNIMCVSAIRQADGKIGFYYITKILDGGTVEGLHSVVCRSLTTDGAHFENQRCEFHAPKGYYIFNNDRLVRLSDGRLVYPAGYLVNPKDSKHIVSTVFISEDDGASFHIHDMLLDLPEAFHNIRGLQEPGIIQHLDGSLRLWMRTDIGYQYECYSYDNLKTFGMPVPSEFTSPCSPMEIERGPDGALYNIYNPIPTYNGREYSFASCYGRNPIVIRKSTDDGKTWSNCQIIEQDKNNDKGFCYPAMFFTDDDCILIAYCRGGTEDGFCLFRTGIRKIRLQDIE